MGSKVYTSKCLTFAEQKAVTPLIINYTITNILKRTCCEVGECTKHHEKLFCLIFECNAYKQILMHFHDVLFNVLKRSHINSPFFRVVCVCIKYLSLLFSRLG